jgi:hypothetical protein
MNTALTPRRTLAAAAAALTLFMFGSQGSAFAADGKPQLTATKATGLSAEGETVTVKGSGYTANVPLFVTVCDMSKGAGRACDTANFKQATADANGAFEVQLKVAAKFGATDCLTTKCTVATSRMDNPRDRTQEALLPVGFTGGVAAGLPDLSTAPAGGAPGAPAASAPSTQPAPPTQPATGHEASPAAGAGAGSHGEQASSEHEKTEIKMLDTTKGGPSAATLGWIILGVAIFFVLAGGAMKLSQRKNTV